MHHECSYSKGKTLTTDKHMRSAHALHVPNLPAPNAPPPPAAALPSRASRTLSPKDWLAALQERLPEADVVLRVHVAHRLPQADVGAERSHQLGLCR